MGVWEYGSVGVWECGSMGRVSAKRTNFSQIRGDSGSAATKLPGDRYRVLSFVFGLGSGWVRVAYPKSGYATRTHQGRIREAEEWKLEIMESQSQIQKTNLK